MFRTLRWRLTAWYGAVALVLLVLFSLGPLVLFFTAPAFGPDHSEEARDAARRTGLVLRETGEPSVAVEAISRPGLWVVVRDGEGDVLASSSGGGPRPVLNAAVAAYPEVTRRGGIFATRLLPAGAGSGSSVEVFVGPPPGGDPTFRGLFPLQAFGIAAALLLMVVLGPAVAAGALRPLRRVSAVARDLGAGRLESRVDLPGLKARRDEVGEVATSFDSMAESLEGLFRAERESKEAMRRFVADASHELRTPLTSIIGYLDVLEEGGETNPKMRQRAFRAMRDEGGRMARLVEDLLTLARLESRGETPHEPVDLAGLAREVAEGHPQRGIAVFAPGPLVVEAPPEALRRVVANLLSNAVKHTPPEGAIEVSVERSAGEAVLEVSDEGSGIPPGDLAHVFERFYRADGSRAGEGTGLGLAIARETVEALGGRVAAESTLGRGSTFSVRLPLS